MVPVLDTDQRLGSSVAGRAAFEAYIAAFNAGDIEGFTAFYTPDVVLRLATRTLNGPAEIAAFYSAMYRCVREWLTIHRVVADDFGIFIEITATFTAHADAPEFLVGPLHVGQKISGRMFVAYRLKDGKIADIQTARIGQITAPMQT